MAVTVMTFAAAYAQQYRTSYFMEGSTVRGYLNPALRPERGYVLIPVLGTTSVNLNSNSLALNTMFYPAGENGTMVSLLDHRVTWHDVAANLRDNNKVGVDLHMALLGAGFYTGRDFWSIEVSMDAYSGVNMPKELVEFVKLGSQAQAYDMSDIQAGADAYANIAMGYSRRITPELTVGGRLNFKFGLARMNVNYDHMNLVLNGDRWAVDARGTIQASMNGLNVPVGPDGYVDLASMDSENLISGFNGIAGFGMTADIGAEYVLMERFKFSAAILNLGFMSWNSNHSFTGRSEESYEFRGMNYTLDPDTNQWVSDGDTDFDFTGFTKFRESGDKARTKMYPGFVLGAEYDIFGNNLLGAGMLFTHRRNEYIARTEFSILATVRPLHWLTASLSYTAGNYKNIGDNFFNSFGFALNVHTSWINWFVGTDYMIFKVNPQFIPTGQKVFNFTFGLSVPLRGPKYDRCH